MNLPTLPPASFLQVDLAPARVFGPSIKEGELDPVRLVITDAHIHVMRLGRNGDIELAHTAELESVVRDLTVGPRGFRITTRDGDIIEAHKSYNCLCGQGRLKSAKFFHPVLAMRALPV
jgi:hypothetical protein